MIIDKYVPVTLIVGKPSNTPANPAIIIPTIIEEKKSNPSFTAHNDDAYAPNATNPACPNDTNPVYPVKILSPNANNVYAPIFTITVKKY